MRFSSASSAPGVAAMARLAAAVSSSSLAAGALSAEQEGIRCMADVSAPLPFIRVWQGMRTTLSLPSVQARVLYSRYRSPEDWQRTTEVPEAGWLSVSASGLPGRVDMVLLLNAAQNDWRAIDISLGTIWYYHYITVTVHMALKGIDLRSNSIFPSAETSYLCSDGAPVPETPPLIH